MKRLLFCLILFAIGFSLGVFVPLKQNSVQANNVKSNFFPSQTDMNNQAYKEWKKADDELNKVYSQILKKYKDDKVFIAKFKKAELAWIKFKDAEIEAIYPDEDKSNYGSVYPMCVNGIATEMTQQRTKELKLWLKGLPEGEVCAGSRNSQ